MPRPRTISDAVVLDAALRLIQDRGPAGVTLEAVASATGLAKATLVQRFGGKAAVLHAALLRAWDLLDERTAAADRAAAPTPAGAVALLVGLSAVYADGENFAGGLLLLREDYRHPALRARGAQWGDVLAAALGRRLTDATGPREDLGRLMAAQWQGTVLWWGFSPTVPLRQAVENALRQWCAAIGRPAIASA